MRIRKESEDLEQKLICYITENKENFYRLAFSYVKNQQDALDIVQDSIYKAIRSVGKLNDPLVIRSWFYRIVVNTAFDFLRRQKKVLAVDEDTLELLSSGQEDVYHNLDLERAIDQLPPKYRSIIILKYFEDLTIEEVAQVMDENINTVKTRLYRALRLLKLEITDHFMEVE